MKNIFFLLISISLVLVGCKKDPLNITPDGRTTLTDIFNDNNETGGYLNSCYNYLQKEGVRYYFWTFLAGFSDEAHDNDDPTENLATSSWYNGGLTQINDPLSQPGGAWNGTYYQNDWKGIRATNVFLANIGTANVTNPVDKAVWTAEARVLRAYYYWNLIQRYGGMPIESQPFPVSYDYTTLKRSTIDSCVQFIVSDCQAAIAEPQLPWRNTTEGDRDRFNKAVAYMIESEATLFNASLLWNTSNNIAKWQQAATISKGTLDALTNNGYALFSNYQTLFYTKPDMAASPLDKETILELKASDGMGQVSYYNGIPTSKAYKAGATPSQELVDAYDMSNGMQAITGYSDANHLNPIINTASGYNDANPYLKRDPRFYSTVLFNGGHYGKITGVDHTIQSYVGGADGVRQNDRHYTHNGYYLRKFVDTTISGGSSNANITWRKWRLAEVYLNLAEAENEAVGPDQIAYNAINAIRERAGMPDLPSGLSQDQFRTRVRNERRIEFAFEGKRFWDVRRWKILSLTDVLTTGMQWTINTNNTLTNQRFVVDHRQSYTDKYLIFPIAATEMSDLPSFQQNPGW